MHVHVKHRRLRLRMNTTARAQACIYARWSSHRLPPSGRPARASLFIGRRRETGCSRGCRRSTARWGRPCLAPARSSPATRRRLPPPPPRPTAASPRGSHCSTASTRRPEAPPSSWTPQSPTSFQMIPGLLKAREIQLLLLGLFATCSSRRRCCAVSI